MSALAYTQGATLPNAAIAVSDDSGNVADLSTSTLALRVGNTRAVVFEKTTGLTYADGVVTVDWELTGEIGDLPTGIYDLTLIADDGTGESRKFRGSIRIRGAVPAA